ncbi:hypothetical protein ARMA_3075 [Ardenticatena maritima]|uniref:CBS domain-containing protein n=1 Tax=Ardenticatena maritima TaxID=872965 RepID=A0A0M8KBI8_9CHLR|nr:CBS domain-containing protein [Ardenticatena maritima]KPL86359.1 hypothetical protein SE16_13635 [Ardenticatena maritima]GAP64652.1 hypothetical protein ARMA_3075 [Ardenticatena maritima]
MTVRNLLSTKGFGTITVHPDTSVLDAVRILAEHNIGAVVVVDDDDRVVGIFTERDLVRHCATQGAEVLHLPVREVMTPDPITALPQDDLRIIAHVMVEKHFRHIPVVEDGQLIGILSIRDVLKAQRDQYLGEIDTLQTRLMERFEWRRHESES